MTMPTNPGAVTRARSDGFKRVTGASIGCSAGDLKGLAIAPSTVEDEGGAGGRRERLLATVANATTNASYLWAASFVAVASLNAVGFGSGADWALSMVSVLQTDSFATSLQEGLILRALIVSDVVCVFLTLAPTPLPSPQLQPEKSPGALASASTSSLLAVAVLLASGVAGVVWALKRKTHPESGDDGEADDWVKGGKASGQGSRKRQPDSSRSTELELVDLAETLGGGEAAFAADLEPALGARRPTRELRSIAHLDSGARLAQVLEDDDEDAFVGADAGAEAGGGWSAKARYLSRVQARKEAAATGRQDDAAAKQLARAGRPLADTADANFANLGSFSGGGAPATTLAPAPATANQGRLAERLWAKPGSNDWAAQDARAKKDASAPYAVGDVSTSSSPHLRPAAAVPDGVAVIPASALKLKPKPFALSGSAQLFKGKVKGRTVLAKRAAGVQGLGAFEREVAVLSALPPHPHLLLLLGVAHLDDDPDAGSGGSTSSVPYLVGGFCGGGTLSAHCRMAAFGAREFLRVGRELLAALAHVHSHGHWHGALCPHHVLLDTGGGVRLAGFGAAAPFDKDAYFAQCDDDEHANAGRRHRSRHMLTPAYVPPEAWAAPAAAKGHGVAASLAAQQQADVYAAAVALWELWHKRAPFDRVPPREVAERVSNGDRPPFALPPLLPSPDAQEELVPRAPFKAPPRLAALVHACWAHNPARRLLAHGLCAAFTERAAPEVEAAAAADVERRAATAPRPGVLPPDALALATHDSPSDSGVAPSAYAWRGGRPAFKGHFAGRPVAALAVRVNAFAAGNRTASDAAPSTLGAFELAAPGTLPGAAALAQAGREAARLAALAKHPNVLAVYGVCAMAWPSSSSAAAAAYSATFFVVTDFVVESDLAVYCRSNAFTLAEFERTGREVVAGLAHLHSHKVAHGNLRPATVRLDRRGRVKLADFGLAALRAAPPDGAAEADMPGGATPPDAGAASMSPEDPARAPYTAPERFEAQDRAAAAAAAAAGAEEADDGEKDEDDAQAADVYALGVTLWELWFRATPFAGQSYAQVSAHVRSGSRLPLQSVPADATPDVAAASMPAALRALVEGCWTAAPASRPLAPDAAAAFASAGASSARLLAPHGSPAAAADHDAGGEAPGANLDPAVLALLQGARLITYAPRFAALGFGDDAEVFGDDELLDDATLLGVGMSKLDVRRLRGALRDRDRKVSSVSTHGGSLPGRNSNNNSSSSTTDQLQAKLRAQAELERLSTPATGGPTASHWHLGGGEGRVNLGTGI